MSAMASMNFIRTAACQCNSFGLNVLEAVTLFPLQLVSTLIFDTEPVATWIWGSADLTQEYNPTYVPTLPVTYPT